MASYGRQQVNTTLHYTPKLICRHTLSIRNENLIIPLDLHFCTIKTSCSPLKKNPPGRTTVYIDKLYECTNGICKKFIFAGNTRIAMKTGGQTSFYHPDHLGSTSVATDAVGNEINDIAYFPFGGTRQESNTTLDSHKYTDQEQDSETGLYNYNARLYDPELGRFMTPDSIVPDPTNPQSLNRYSYVQNNPLNYTDPTGHLSWRKVRGYGAIVVGGGSMVANAIWGKNDPVVCGLSASLIAYGVDQLGGDSNVTFETPVASWDGPPPSQAPSSSSSNSSSNTSSASNSNSSNNSNSGTPVGPSSGTRSAGYNYGYGSYQDLSLDYGGFDGVENMNSSFSVVASMASGVRTATIGGFGAAQVAIPGATNSVLNMAKNGPLAAQATLGFAALTVVGPVSYATGYATGPYLMTAAGTPQGQLWLDRFLDTASSLYNPTSQPKTYYGAWGTYESLRK